MTNSTFSFCVSTIVSVISDYLSSQVVKEVGEGE